jgi:hypothetical protein
METINPLCQSDRETIVELLRKLELEGERKMKLLHCKTVENMTEYIGELDAIMKHGEDEFRNKIGRDMTAMEKRKVYG